MGNCLFGQLGNIDDHIIKVITSTGGIMEFDSPVTVESITDEFPGHAIFRTHDLFWQPIPDHEFLVEGNSYYLLPLNSSTKINIGHVRSNKSVPGVNNNNNNVPVVPYRMSFDSRGVFKRSYTGTADHGFSRNNTSIKCSSSSSSSNSIKRNRGFWKVKLVISPEQLLEILSQEGSTEELIENVRTVAKCGNEAAALVSACSNNYSSNSSTTTTTTAAAFSDQWSLCSSTRNIIAS